MFKDLRSQSSPSSPSDSGIDGEIYIADNDGSNDNQENMGNDENNDDQGRGKGIDENIDEPPTKKRRADNGKCPLEVLHTGICRRLPIFRSFSQVRF